MKKIIVLVLLSLLTVSSSIQAGMVVNGDFETGALGDYPGWYYAVGGTIIDTDSSGYGTKCVEAAMSSAPYSIILTNAWYFPAEGEQYQLKLDAKVLQGTVNGGDSLAQIRCWNGSITALTAYDTIVLSPTTDWQTYTSNVVTIPAGTVYMDVVLYPDYFGLSSGTMRLDNVDFTKVPEPATMSLLAFGALALIRRK